MRKNFYPLLALVTLFFTWHTVAAQNDSLLDLGRIKIRKDFAQTITIKASDLQKIPFGTLSDVLVPWLHGSMNSKAKLVFVVDGNLVNDANAWSIYDIEEITLVQNAMVQVNGAINEQQLVLVKTKRNNGEKGITVAGSSAMAIHDVGDPFESNSETNYYHQYYIGARKDLGKIRVGASANWVRDVFPMVKLSGLEAETPQQLNRFRINGWLDVSLAEGHIISAGLNYVPQNVSYEFTSGIINTGGINLSNQYGKFKQTLLNPYIKLSNRIAEGLTNELSFSYLNVRMPSNSRYVIEYIMPSPPNQVFSSIGEETEKTRTLLLREQLSYRKNFGDWTFGPSLNFTYRSVKQSSVMRTLSQDNNNPPVINLATWRYEADSYVLTPSVGISHKNSFYLAGGVAASLTDDTKPMGDGVFPFATAMVDLLRLGNTDNPQSLKIFGSWSKAPDFADQYFSQNDVSGEPGPTHGIQIDPVYYPGVVITNPYPEDAKRNSIQAGAVFATAGNKLQLSYNFDLRRYVDLLMYEIPTPQGNVWTITWPDHKFTSHRLGVLAKLMEKPGFQWQSGFNVTTFKSKITADQFIPANVEVENNNGKTIWTGGFTNRMQAGRFSFGLDLLYQFNEQRWLFSTPTAENYQKINSWRLNNFYVAYNPQLLKNRPLEVYLTARNSLSNNSPGFPGKNVMYFGAGFKLQY